MPQIKSQIKRVKITAIENDRNAAKRSRVKNIVKKYNAVIDAKDAAAAETLLREAVGVIESAYLDGIYKRNTASRKISALSKKLSALKKNAEA
ncbi:MAG: 30S ribosomal protein S20 [Clostridiales bacterium]|nr:30S ribosomal protein S20 [Clostridiales bacterium]